MAATTADKERALEQCERDLDLVMERLMNMQLDPATNGEGAAAAPDGNQAHLATAEAESVLLPVPPCGRHAEWAELLFDRMNGAADVDDAKARTAALLEAFQGSVAAASRAELKVAVWQNGVLKKAVLLQHRLHRAQEEANRELRRQVVGCQERVRKLETDNYALAMHLRQAQQQGSSMHGRFHPEVF